jgi:NAD(P)-dependent dehydrogenase (short-subunit alcohol dehydrogenase family)
MTQPAFADRVAIITGGARGIGLASARRMASEGATVVLWDADAAALAQASAELGGGVNVSTDTVDVTDRAVIAAAHQAVLARHGRIDILVNSAGITGPNFQTLDYPIEDWRRVIEIASLAGKEGTPTMSAYDAAKAGVIALTKAMGKELAMSGVLVNCIAPAAIATDMVAGVDPEAVRIMVEKSPMRRLGTADECAALVR